MAHEWDRGVLSASSWHRLETVKAMTNLADMMAHGQLSGAWPTSVDYQELFTPCGLKAPATAIVGRYQEHGDRVIGVVGDRYTATTPADWEATIAAAIAAGAKPTGAFSLRDGSRVIATFEVGTANGLRTNLLLADAFDGSMKLTCGVTSIRVVCANTMAMSMSLDGKNMAKCKHTSSLPLKIQALQHAIGEAINAGQTLRATYEAANAMRLTRDQRAAVAQAMFPDAENGSKAGNSRAANKREELAKAMQLPVNRTQEASLAWLWNAATFLVDRTVTGEARPARGNSDALDSLLFGARAARVQELQEIVKVVLTDGTEALVSASRAQAAGVDVGKAVLASMLD